MLDGEAGKLIEDVPEGDYHSSAKTFRWISVVYPAKIIGEVFVEGCV
jgi:hypothetical protein